MKLKNKILSLSIIFLILTVLGISSSAYATTATSPLYLGIEEYRNSGYAYKAISKIMWKISSYSDEEGSDVDKSRTIYCIKAGPGFGSTDMGGSYVGATTIRPYTQYFDFKDRDSITGNYLNAIPSGANYNSLVWVLEHCYVPTANGAAEYREELLKAAGIQNSTISDDEIDVTQQLAIWYFTNEDNYKITTETFALDVKEKADAAYKAIGDKFLDGDSRNDDAIVLFNYLVEQGLLNSTTVPTATKNTNPITLNNANVTMSLEGTNYIVGPYTITAENNIEYTLEAILLNGQDTIPYTILDANKSTSTIENVVGKEFYLSIPVESYVEGAKFTITTKTYQTALTYWSVTNAPTIDQPVVEIEKKEYTYKQDVTMPNKPKEKEFDLSLRKFIATVNNKELKTTDGTYIKEPSIDLTPLINKTGTTANYNHRKDPIGIALGDEVIYTIRVYNEGDIDGYVTEITDYLPPQLEFINDEFNAKYGWTANGRTIKTTITSPQTIYSASRDEIYNDRTQLNDKVLLKAFDGTTLDYIEVQIKCKVKENIEIDEVITNIAEITGFTDSNNNAITDRDSQKDNVILPIDENLPDYKGNDSNKSILNDSKYFYKGQQDDDDFDKLILEEFDLALRKFITAVNENKVTNRYPIFTTNKDENGNYIYSHTKEPVLVQSTDLVEYTIRIYNEGNIAGYAKEIKDNIPEGLEFVLDSDVNKQYSWKMLDENGNETTDVSEAEYITTDYLSKEQESSDGDNLLNGFDRDTMATPEYKDVKVVFKVVAPSTYKEIITNIAEISKDSDEVGNEIEDKDSVPDNNKETEDDIDKEHIKLTYFDLALRKFITNIQDNSGANATPENREPVFSIDENGNYTYTHSKEPLYVENGNIVTYTLRIYNEGTINGYAKQVKDDIPDGLEFLPDNNINQEYRWKMLDEDGNETTEVSKAVSIVTDYLSKEQEELTNRDNLLLAFNKDQMQQPDYRDIEIAFKVTEPNTSDRIIINYAQISDDSDEKGNDIVDIDSTPDKWIDGEDDQDIEKIKVKYFDLALRKWVTQAIVIENGKETITETGHKAEDDPEQVVKVEIAKNKINKVTVKFRYKIRVTNEGEIAGYAKEISDYIPDGLKFVKEDNPDWKQVEDKIVTDKLKDTLLQPGESAEVEVLLTWINGNDNLGLKVNVAEISKDYNESNTPDIDSTPNNKKDGEDDIDDAPVILTVKTGEVFNTQNIILGVVILVIISSGIVLIKKYIL